MPTVSFVLTDTNAVEIVKPPKHRKVRVKFVRLYNKGGADATVTLRQVSPDGGQTKDVDEIMVTAGQEKEFDAEVVYDLDRGFKLTGALDAAGSVRVTVTYELL